MNIYLTMTPGEHGAGQMIEWAGGEMAVKGERGMGQPPRRWWRRPIRTSSC